MVASTKLAAAFSVLAAAAAVFAAPAKVFKEPGNVDVVFRPQITSPMLGDVWATGSTQTITWDTSGIPVENQNQTGLVLLGYTNVGDSNEHLDIQHPLASGFPITAGSVNITVPPVEGRDDYTVVLFGDSGNASPLFTITNSTSSATESSLPTTEPLSGSALPTAA